ncbi:unnamed protein product [Cunninghamella blakesleeana]
MGVLKTQTCCGFIPLHTAVLIITIFGILNKLSGFYGLISFDFSDGIAFAVYIYSLFALLVCAYGLYGIHTHNIRILRWYTMFYWIDCIISTVTTVWFATKWYIYTDHSLSDEMDMIKQQEHDESFKMESMVSIGLLVVLRFIHFYFALIITNYYRSMGHKYTKISIDNEFD